MHPKILAFRYARNLQKKIILQMNWNTQGKLIDFGLTYEGIIQA